MCWHVMMSTCYQEYFKVTEICINTASQISRIIEGHGEILTPHYCNSWNLMLWNLNKMAAILQITFSQKFSRINVFGILMEVSVNSMCNPRHPYHQNMCCFPMLQHWQRNPDSKVHGANMGPIWGRQDPGGPHVGPMNSAIWECYVDEIFIAGYTIIC